MCVGGGGGARARVCVCMCVCVSEMQTGGRKDLRFIRAGCQSPLPAGAAWIPPH